METRTTRSRALANKQKDPIPSKKGSNDIKKSKSSSRKPKTIDQKQIKESKPEVVEETEEQERVVQESPPPLVLSNQKQSKQPESSGTSALFDKLLVEHSQVIKTYSRSPTIKTLADVQLEGLTVINKNSNTTKTKKASKSTASGKKKTSQKADNDIVSKRKKRETK